MTNIRHQNKVKRNVSSTGMTTKHAKEVFSKRLLNQLKINFLSFCPSFLLLDTKIFQKLRYTMIYNDI